MTTSITKQKRAQTYDRDTALGAAQALFWRKGYHATSLKDLEAALNMKPGSIYAAFKNKENLYLLTLERYYDAGRAEIEAQINSAPSPLQGLADHLRSYGNAASGSELHNACMLVKTQLETTVDDDAIAARTREYLSQITTVFEDAFKAAKARGELPSDANTRVLAHKFQAYIAALRIEAHRSGATEILVALAEDFAADIENLKRAH